MKRFLALLLSATLLLTVLAGCGGKPPAVVDPAEKDSFIIALDSDIIRLDPALAFDFTTNPVINQITQGILCFDEDNQLVPLLAESWEQTDELTYVYQIRSDVTFSDGTPMTMDDVLYSLGRHTDGSVASYLDWVFDSVETMEATGEWELTVKLHTPDATFQYGLATTAGHVLQKAHAEAAGDKLGDAETGIIGTGPYTYVSWKSGDEIVLTKNENYWNTDAGHFQNLIFKIIEEDSTRVAAMLSGSIDCTVAPPASQMSVLKDAPNVTLSTEPGFGVTFVAFNTEKTPFDNVKVRQAIEMAIDFDAIQTNLVMDAGDASTALPSSDALFTVEPERWFAYRDNAPKHVYNPEGALALLTEAGYPEGFDCTLICSEDGLRNAIAVSMQEYLTVIGINMEIQRVSGDEHTLYQFGEYKDENGIRQYDMIMAGWEADYPDPAGNLEPLFTGGIDYNSAAYNNEAVNTLIAAQKQESDPTLRNDMMFGAFDIITKDMPYLFIFYPIKSIAINSAYEGVYMNASWIWNIHFQNVAPIV